MKKRYQIDKQRAAQQFRKKAGASNENIPFPLPLPGVFEMAQKGLMGLALEAVTKLAGGMILNSGSSTAAPASSTFDCNRFHCRAAHPPGDICFSRNQVRLKSDLCFSRLQLPDLG